MSKYPVTVFDMDGTLIDSVPGIVNGVKYTLDRLKMEPPEDFDIRPCLGPPLAWTFETHLRVPPAKVEEAIADYREYYGKTGAFEAEI